MSDIDCKITAVRTCRFCAGEFKIHAEFFASLECMEFATGEAIDTELDRLGWLAGACPGCAVTHRKTLIEEHRADDDPEWEGGKYV